MVHDRWWLTGKYKVLRIGTSNNSLGGEKETFILNENETVEGEFEVDKILERNEKGL